MPADPLRARIAAMNDGIRHRGPDDGGVWLEERTGIALANRRLSILDLSPAGHQPMLSSDGRYVLVYNGETYNFGSLRERLVKAGRRFVGRSDTEAILEGFVEWGIQPTIERLNGMFALAIWDREANELTLARDRAGIKPLYYGSCANGTFCFGSELKALTASPDWRGEIDRDSVLLYLRLGYIPAPHSIYRGISKLEPGQLLTVTDGGRRRRTTCYWSIRDVASRGTRQPFQGTEVDATDHLERLLEDSVRRQMCADVPLGAFLSGGIDSSTVVALMQSDASGRVRTFSIGSTAPGYDEARYAKAVAQHLGAEHTELYVSHVEAAAVIPSLARIYDEPFADSSQIPTVLVSRLARQQVTVSLSGDGGDELLGGYSHYLLFRRYWKLLQTVPRLARTLTAALGRRNVVPRIDVLQRVVRIAGDAEPELLYRTLLSQWKVPAQIVTGGAEPLSAFTTPGEWLEGADVLERIMYLDFRTYLPDDILVKVDRASMAVGLEARVPILDHRVVEFCWTLPLSLKIRDGRGKWLLRQVLARHLPAEYIDRPKMGFSIPVGEWLRGPLRAWAEDLLDERVLAQDGIFAPAAVRDAWQRHLRGEARWDKRLWTVLMFRAWQQAWTG